MDYAEDEVRRDTRRVTVGSSNRWVPLAVDELHEERCCGMALTPAEARALAALLLKHADRAEGRGREARLHARPCEASALACALGPAQDRGLHPPSPAH